MPAPRPNEITPHLIRWIRAAIERAPPGHVPLLFLSGPQGSGKTTALAEAVAALDAPVPGLGLDDFYLTRVEREALARRVSAMFRVRGPPGTHDLALLCGVIAGLRSAGEAGVTQIPVFDKLADERLAAPDWRTFTGRPAAIVIEGWLMGALVDPSAPGSAPVNAVEEGDVRTDWRRVQEEHLAGPYADLWDEADGFLHILAPGFETVLRWRMDQEESLWAAKGEPMPPDRIGWVHVFVQHYERITRRMLAGARRPGAEIRIDAQRRVTETSDG